MFVYPTPKPAVLVAITVLAEAFGEYASVSAKLPINRPAAFVRVSRVGGGLANVASDTARILVECFARDVAQVESMLNTARTALRNAGGTTISIGDEESASIRGWGNENIVNDFPHPDIVDFERGQLTGDLTIKAN